MNTRVALVIAAAAAATVGATKKCTWLTSDERCEFNFEALDAPAGSQMAKIVEIVTSEFTCKEQATKSSCEAADPSCIWSERDSKCDLSKAVVAKRWELMPGDVDASPMCKLYTDRFACDDHGDETACNAAGSPCIWEADQGYTAGSIEGYHYQALTDSCVGKPSMPGRCETHSLQAICPGIEATDDFEFLQAGTACSDSNENDDGMIACMEEKGACSGMYTEEAVAAYRRNKAEGLSWNSPTAAQADVMLIGGTLKACLAEKTCAAYADIVSRREGLAYVAGDFPLETCSDFNDERTCPGSCLWSGSECKSKKSILASEFPSFGAECPLHRMYLIMGATSGTDAGKLAIWSEKKQCEQAGGESNCTRLEACAFEPPSNRTHCDEEGTKSIHQEVGKCEWQDKTKKDDAAQLEMYQLYLGASWNQAMMDLAKTCLDITEKSSCESEVMSESEKAMVNKAGSVSGAMGLGASGGLGFWSACACMAALLLFVA